MVMRQLHYMNKLILRPFLHDSQRVTIQVRQPGKTTQVSTEPAPHQSKHASPTVITFITTICLILIFAARCYA